MGCGDEKLSKYLTQTFTAHCNAMICQQVTLSGDAEWPKVADAVIEAIEKRTDQGDVKIVQCQRRRCFAKVLLGKAQQQTEGVAVAGDRVGAGPFLAHQPVGEEGFQQGRKGDG